MRLHNLFVGFFQVILIVLVIFTSTSNFGQGNFFRNDSGPEFLNISSAWADSVLNTLSLDEQIGQLFMVATWSNKGEEHQKEIKELIDKHHIGGLIFFQGGPQRQVNQLKSYQQLSKIPLMIGMDAEWGLAMRLDSTLKYPKQMTLGAIDNDTLIYKMGIDIAEQLGKIGVHVNFAPVADVNNNSENPVINYRSFGEDVEKVCKKSYAYAKGLQDGGILANAKHFPGHGDTDVDSHKDLPTIGHNRQRLDTVELAPFKFLISRNIASMMVAHLYVPALDATENLPTTLSRMVVDSLLKKEFGFKGLVFTDALNMKGVTKFFDPGGTDNQALIAGNDVLLYSLDVEEAKNRIKETVSQGMLDSSIVAERCHKILMAKKWLNLNDSSRVFDFDDVKHLNSAYSQNLIERLYAEAITLISNDRAAVPLPILSKKSRGLVIVGDYLDNAFHKAIKNKHLQKAIAVPNDLGIEKIESTLLKLKGLDDIVMSIHGLSQKPSADYGLTPQTIELIDSLANHHRLIINYFGNPYGLSKYPALMKKASVMVMYEDNDVVQRVAAKALFEEMDIKGKLPVSINDDYPVGTGIQFIQNKLKYGFPEEVGFNEKTFFKIDSIVENGLEERAYPGCVVLVAKDERIIYHKAFGHKTYEEKDPILLDDIYDIASITKVVSTTSAIMRLVEEGKVDLNKKLGDYLDIIPDTSFIYNAVLRDVLTHQAGLRSWIPFYLGTLEDGKLNPSIYNKTRTDAYNIRVSKDLYMHQTYVDSIYHKIVTSKARPDSDYKYSDLGFYLLPLVVEKITGEEFDKYVAREFFEALNLETMTYRPLDHFSKDRIVPTEYDLYFRNELLQGYVHDPGAAMLGGVSGHAGVFSNAYDLAVFMQMLVNRGEYNTERFFDPETIEEFTTCQFCDGTEEENRRGIGFDKPNRFGNEGPTCDCISHNSYGHSGFTGVLAWADPEEKLVYVFLSNRIYPSAKNKKLISMNIRTEIMQVIYDALKQGNSLTQSN